MGNGYYPIHWTATAKFNRSTRPLFSLPLPRRVIFTQGGNLLPMVHLLKDSLTPINRILRGALSPIPTTTSKVT